MQIEFAHICESVIIAQNGNLSIINIFNQIKASSFPAIHHKMTVVMGAMGAEGEYEVGIQFRKQGEETSIEKILPQKIKIPQSPAQGRLYINFSPLPIKSAGTYEIVLSLAGQTKKLFFEAITA